MILLVGCSSSTTAPEPETVVSKKPADYDKIYSSYSSDKELFEKSFANVAVEPEVKKVYGAIASHHLLSANSMAELFTSLQGQEIATIVVVGPNHFNTGNNKILITDNPYRTPYGVLEPDIEVINKLIKGGLVAKEEKPFNEEHSISTLVPYIKRAWPEVKLVPIIVKASVDDELAEHLGLQLQKHLPEKSLVLVSCDFAHHVDKKTAEEYDKKSLEVLNNFNLDDVYKMEVDSPASIYTLFAYLKQKESQKFVLVKNTNAAEILKMPEYDDVTSYIFGYFIKSK